MSQIQNKSILYTRCLNFRKLNTRYLHFKRNIMHLNALLSLFFILSLFQLSWCDTLHAQNDVQLHELFQSPPEAAKPWVYWYWMHAAVSREGITADLEAMKDAGIGGAYLFHIKGITQPPLYEPPVEQLTPEWYEMVRFAMAEAARLGLKMAMHSCDGFTVAGGPWITPEMSMQKVVWTETLVSGMQHFNDTLPQPA